jgi:hypothetical protein
MQPPGFNPSCTVKGELPPWEIAEAFAFHTVKKTFSEQQGEPASKLLGKPLAEYIAEHVTCYVCVYVYIYLQMALHNYLSLVPHSLRMYILGEKTSAQNVFFRRPQLRRPLYSGRLNPRTPHFPL